MQKTTINPPQVRLVTMTKLSSSKAVVLSGVALPHEAAPENALVVITGKGLQAPSEQGLGMPLNTLQ